MDQTKLDKELLNYCNEKWRESPHYYNLTPSSGAVKFIPANKLHSVKETEHSFIVILDAGIGGMPKFEVNKNEFYKFIGYAT